MRNQEQTIVMAEIRQLKKHEKEQDKRIANLELKENVNGATILKAINNLVKENREEHQKMREDINALREDNKSLHEDNKNIHKELNDLHEDNKNIHRELQKINNKLDLMFELLSKRS